MWEYIINNLATIIISILLIIAFFFIIKSIIKNRKSCDGNCGSCGVSKTCNKDILAELRRVIKE